MREYAFFVISGHLDVLHKLGLGLGSGLVHNCIKNNKNNKTNS